MKKNRKSTLGITLIITLLLAVMTTGIAFADGGEIVEGIVKGIYEDDLKLQLEVEKDGLLELIWVVVGENFNFDSVVLEDLVTLTGVYDDDGALVVSELKIMERIQDQLKLQDGELESYYCTTDNQHPVALKAADTYAATGITYDIIEGYLCGEPSIPLGQIMLALQTAVLTDGNYEIYLDGFENSSWGQVWQELDLQGKPAKGTAPGQIKQGEVDPEETDADAKGKKNQDGDGLCDEEDNLFCEVYEEVYEWFQQPQKGKNNQ